MDAARREGVPHFLCRLAVACKSALLLPGQI
jgi:hypothetical protein